MFGTNRFEVVPKAMALILRYFSNSEVKQSILDWELEMSLWSLDNHDMTLKSLMSSFLIYQNCFSGLVVLIPHDQGSPWKK